MVLETRLDRSSGKQKYQNWDELVFGFHEPAKGNKQSLLQRHLDEEEHIKPTELKRRVNQGKKYRRSVKHLQDLTSYIHFVREHKDED
jgi:hypothetical protein